MSTYHNPYLEYYWRWIEIFSVLDRVLCVCNKHCDNLKVAPDTIYITVLCHCQYPLMFPWGWVVLWQSFRHSSLSFHKYSFRICVQPLSSLFCMCFLTCSMHLFIGLLNGCLFYIFIFGVLKAYCWYTCIIHVHIIVFIIWLTVLEISQNSEPYPCCGRETMSEVEGCWTGWSKIQFLELPQNVEGLSGLQGLCCDRLW
jgi:hypothetical protein